MALWTKYIGTVGTRVITPRDWEAAEVKEETLVRWNRSNGWTVDISGLSKAAQEVILNDPEIVQITETFAKSEQEGVRRMPREQRIRSATDRARVEPEGSKKAAAVKEG